MDHHPEDVLQVFLHRSREVIQKPSLREKLRAIADAVVEAGLFQRVAVQLYSDQYGEKLFGCSGLSAEEEEWMAEHDTLSASEYDRVREFGVDLGNLYFIPHDQLKNVVENYDSFLLSSHAAWEGPGFWHPDDMLFAPLLAADGTPLGNLTADEPFNERIPTEETAALMTPFLAIASLLVEQALERRRDTLTGCFNGPFFRDELSQLAASHQLSGLLFLDMDNLKQINDQNGHAAGDRLIQDTAQGLEEMIRTVLGRHGTVFRLHGDEFVVLIRRGAPPISQLRQILREERDRKVPNLSLGAAPYEPGRPLWELLFFAEQAMYQDKWARKGKVTT